MNQVVKLRVIAVESSTKRGRWHFAVVGPVTLGPRRLTKSLNTWSSKRSAVRAGKREYNL